LDDSDLRTIWRSDRILHADGERYYLHTGKNTTQILVADITPQIYTQRNLLVISGWAIVLSTIITGLFSRIYTRYILRDLTTLSNHISTIDMQHLDQTLQLDHLPDHDQIATITSALNTMTSTLDDQISQIKRFVSNLSHEIKTPLMASRTSAELALKKNTPNEGLQTTMQHIDQISRLVDVLSLLHQAEYQVLDNEQIAIE
jgi:methyl-accepting chemotaxis protein